ncbi:4-hydroxythreonine-4-phosphate dehydrogenase PdxA [Candidatus Methylacidithermus pantelleriae]|uniref:4-hydroxythreonine-4-phosphate dehydrogenase n=1 Tax=Candidatus Methylacidithermus pantelleriae TaxID=2744239 RepID=A0A8J2BI21_9BACT|nr:4-hydroxythreonine-4-phosphate dehydrogenase PdxA [Candidatus Methylacidithermus pantelleriae]CAF0692010.1 4-hydroxythreonine-4-phosphate dehydrogenase [Candidatus Methylacidithermus pantelleriae]
MRAVRIGITLGDPAGIGPEVVFKALASRKIPRRGVNYILLGSQNGMECGRLSKESAQAAWDALEEAFQMWRKGELDALVTGPIHKENMARVGFPFPGHTEFLSVRCGFEPDRGLMLLYHPKLSVALATTHCSLKEALQKLSVEKFVRLGWEVHRFLVLLGKPRPRIALAGVNPHAGEQGLFGQEEREILEPARKVLAEKGIEVSCPISPDAVFRQAYQGLWDCVLCAYHDQGLIPFKLVAFRKGVNVTLGLPLVRTSPDHGTAVELAGKGKADASSMVEAIRLAVRLTRQRRVVSEEDGWHRQGLGDSFE